MTAPQFTPGTIIIPINETAATVITLPPVWHEEVVENATHHHDRVQALELAQRLLTNPNHETGNTALIRAEIRQALIHLAHVAGSALTQLAEDEEED